MLLENIFRAQTVDAKIQKLECSVLQSHVIPHCHVIQGRSRQGAKSNVSDQMEHKPFFLFFPLAILCSSLCRELCCCVSVFWGSTCQ